MKKRTRYLFISLILGLAILATTILAGKPALAQNEDQPAANIPSIQPLSQPMTLDTQHQRAVQHTGEATSPTRVQPVPNAARTLGPASPFDWTRFDGAFVPGPVGETWANKVYFLGGRSGSSIEDSTIWKFDPVTGTPPFEYNWDFGDGITSILESPTHLYTATDTYTVTLTVTSDWGTATDLAEFVVNATPYTHLYLPLLRKMP